MKAAYLLGPEKIEVRDVERPVPGYGEVLVRVRACGICTLEQRLYTGAMKIFYPLVPGHEASGEVVDVGEGVISDLKHGMRVALDLVNRCGECYFCRIGKSNQCINRFKKGQRVLGGFAEYVVVKSKQVFVIPDSLSFEEAAFSEPVACCIHSLKKVNLQLAEDVLIIGAGPMGLMHVQVANAMGARVFVSDVDDRRLEIARKLGAFAVFNPSGVDVPGKIREYTDGRGADVCIVTTPAHVALKTGLDSISQVGRLNIYTSYSDTPSLPIDANSVHHSEKLITGSEGRTEYDFLQAVRLLSFKKVNVKPLISETYPLKDVENGIKRAMSPETLRVLLVN